VGKWPIKIIILKLFCETELQKCKKIILYKMKREETETYEGGK
jgi:hypothetical protein